MIGTKEEAVQEIKRLDAVNKKLVDALRHIAEHNEWLECNYMNCDCPEYAQTILQELNKEQVRAMSDELENCPVCNATDPKTIEVDLAQCELAYNTECTMCEFSTGLYDTEKEAEKSWSFFAKTLANKTPEDK